MAVLSVTGRSSHVTRHMYSHYQQLSDRPQHRQDHRAHRGPRQTAAGDLTPSLYSNLPDHPVTVSSVLVVLRLPGDVSQEKAVPGAAAPPVGSLLMCAGLTASPLTPAQAAGRQLPTQ